MSVRSLIAGLALASVALASVGVVTYRAHSKAPAPLVPIVYAPETLAKSVAPAPPPAVKKRSPKAEREARRAAAQKAKRERRAMEADARAKLAKGKLSCSEVREAVAKYPPWLLKKLHGLATADQIEQGQKCIAG